MTEQQKHERRLCALARKIARDLFTDGSNRPIDRLVCEYAGELPGRAGWSEIAVADQIFTKLLQHPTLWRPPK